MKTTFHQVQVLKKKKEKKSSIPLLAHCRHYMGHLKLVPVRSAALRNHSFQAHASVVRVVHFLREGENMPVFNDSL